jgi:elongation factor P
MISVNDLRSGTAFFEGGQAWVVVTFEHIKMGRGTATIKVKVKNLKTGSIVEKSFINNEKVEDAATSKKQLQYLYQDGKSLVFMDPRSFEQFNISTDITLGQEKYLKEGINVNVAFLEEDNHLIPLSIDIPMKMAFTIAETDPGVKGDSAVNIFKSAKLDNGMVVKVPLFVNAGERVVIDTRSGEYMGRAA